MMVRTVLNAAVVGLVALAAWLGQPSTDTGNDKDAHGVFTGEVKLVFYVTDVRKAVAFYTDALGFRFEHYYDHVSGGSVETWSHDTPPIYAEMSYAGRRFGLHAPTGDADRKSVGAAKVYFRVKDLEAHHRRTAARGAHPGEIKKRSWMDMFQVEDSDGNRIFFAYTDDKTHGNPWYGS